MTGAARPTDQGWEVRVRLLNIAYQPGDPVTIEADSVQPGELELGCVSVPPGQPAVRRTPRLEVDVCRPGESGHRGTTGVRDHRREPYRGSGGAADRSELAQAPADQLVDLHRAAGVHQLLQRVAVVPLVDVHGGGHGAVAEPEGGELPRLRDRRG